VSLFHKRVAGLDATQLVAQRTMGRNGRIVRVNRDAALRHSAVWACLRLRADLLSTMPIDVFRRVNGVQVELPKPLIITEPGGPNCRSIEWRYSTQVDLDSTGNTVGLILARDGAGKPVMIEPFDIDRVSFVGRGSKITKVRYGGEEYDYSQIWHEKQFTKAGCAVGLSPIAYAASSINSYLSAQEFATDWFGNSAVPGGILKNVTKTLNPTEATAAKESFKASVSAGDVWVAGNDWEYSMVAAKASESQFLETIDASISEICRFFGVPGDMIDAPTKGSSVTYANVTQRNLQLLIMNIGPAITRREDAWSYGLLPQPRYVKLNRGALLEMDIASRYAAHKTGIDSRFLAPSEAREHENLPPFTPEQLAEFQIFAKTPTPKEGL
jgi:HK97 family phage portal protein